MFKTVTSMLIEPSIEEAPATCKEKIAKSTLPPLCASMPESGKYTVQPVPAPPSTSDDVSSKRKATGNSQKEMLFSRGNAMSGAPIMRGRNQLPKPPISIGITEKKIKMKA